MINALIVAGLSGVGKTSAGQYLNSRTSATHIEASTYMRQIWMENGGRGKLQTFASRSLKANPSLVAERILHDCHRMGIENIIITGFRSPIEVATTRSAARKSALMLITATPTLRLERLKARGRDGDPETLADLAALDAAHFAMGQGRLIDDVDASLDNNTSADGFQRGLVAYANDFFSEHRKRCSQRPSRGDDRRRTGEYLMDNL